MPDRCSKFEESKHSAPIFCRISSAQRGGGVFVRSLEGSTFRNSELLFAKVCRFFLESLGTCMLVGDLLVCMSSTLRHPI
jgi:hypothetical protein